MTTSYTRWASEGGGIDSGHLDLHTYDEDRYQIALETRPWPQDVTKTLVDFRIGLRDCTFPPFAGLICSRPVTYTLWASQLQTGALSWSPTLDTSPANIYSQIDLQVDLR